MFEKSCWIWADGSAKMNDRVDFFVDFEVETIPEKAILSIGAETKYRLFVNGKAVVLDGGLFRESRPGCGYFEGTDVAPYLKIGKNELTVCVWFFGNGGRNNVRCERPGLIFECESLGLYSGKDVLCHRGEGWYDMEGKCLYGGHNVAYNAQKRPFSLCPEPYGAVRCEVVGRYGDAPWGELYEREIPPFYFSERRPLDYTKEGDVAEAKLPYAMQFSPYFIVTAEGGEKISIYTDRAVVNGGPGDSGKYGSRTAEYICREGKQEFEVPDWLFGEKLMLGLGGNVRIDEMGYRESGYFCEITGTFKCDDKIIERLFEKSARTLKVCMRENFMDCPDRERGQWIGDVSVQAPQVVYLMPGALPLLKKAIGDFINLRKGKRLVGNVPGEDFLELPSQSLNAISEFGMISTYYEATKDVETLEKCFVPAVEYLALWETDADGVPVERKGDWCWYDHLFNIDGEVIGLCWYYSALGFLLKAGKILNNRKYEKFLSSRRAAIERNFTGRYWNGSYFSSGNFADDRANALAVLVGLCPREYYGSVKFVLTEVYNSTCYMEGYVLSALCEMGYKEDAFRRMKSRYLSLAENDNSTLWEDFTCLGTKNHAWSGAPATILFKYFGGVGLGLEREETDIAPLKFAEFSYLDADGKRRTFTVKNDK